jgi:DNA-binding NarL/FixJ family response regulator
MEREAAHGCKRVVLADLVGPGRAALASLLAGIPGVALVGEVGEPEALQSAIWETDPDVLVVDDRLLAGAPDGAPQMIVMGADDDPGFAARAERLGALAWIPKESADAFLPALLAGPLEEAVQKSSRR